MFQDLWFHIDLIHGKDVWPFVGLCVLMVPLLLLTDPRSMTPYRKWSLAAAPLICGYLIITFSASPYRSITIAGMVIHLLPLTMGLIFSLRSIRPQYKWLRWIGIFMSLIYVELIYILCILGLGIATALPRLVEAYWLKIGLPLVAILWCMFLWKLHTGRKWDVLRQQSNDCPHCGYNLHGSLHEWTCPECGGDTSRQITALKMEAGRENRQDETPADSPL